jgi:hypothetical protein
VIAPGPMTRTVGRSSNVPMIVREFSVVMGLRTARGLVEIRMKAKLVYHASPTGSSSVSQKAHASHRCGLYGVTQFQRCADVPESFLGSTRSGDENVPIAKNPGADALVDRHRLDLLNLHFERSPF